MYIDFYRLFHAYSRGSNGGKCVSDFLGRYLDKNG